jgi:hypothetical protein
VGHPEVQRAPPLLQEHSPISPCVAQLEQWVTQKYTELLQNPESIRCLVSMHNTGTLPPDAAPHINIIKKLMSDQQKAAGIQAKYTALILACQKQALAQGDRRKAQLTIRGLQQKQEEERRRALAEQQEYVRQEAAKMALDVVEKEAASARALSAKKAAEEGGYANGFPGSLFQREGEGREELMEGFGSLLSPGFDALPSPESFFASGSPGRRGFGSVEKLPGGHSALRGEAARSESPGMFPNGGLSESLQFYPRSMSPLPFQQSPAFSAGPADNPFSGGGTPVGPGGLEWSLRPGEDLLEKYPDADLIEDRVEERGVGGGAPETAREGEGMEPVGRVDKSLKNRKEEMRGVGRKEEENRGGVKKPRVVQESVSEDSPVIGPPVASPEELPTDSGLVSEHNAGESDANAAVGGTAKGTNSKAEETPLRQRDDRGEAEASGSDSEDEPLILTASKRALGIGGGSKELAAGLGKAGAGKVAGGKAEKKLGGLLSKKGGLVGSHVGKQARGETAADPAQVRDTGLVESSLVWTNVRAVIAATF